MSTAPAAAAAAPPKFKRSAKNYLLDSKFQLKYTGYIVVTTMVVSLALGFLLYGQSDKTVKLGNEAVQVGSEANKAGQEAVQQSKSLTTIIEISADKAYGDNPTLLEAMKEDNKRENDNIEKRAAALSAGEAKLKEQRNALAHQRTVLMATLGGVLAALVVLLGLGGIVVTHKIVGPIFKMKRLLREVGDGNFHVQGRLRKGDELQEFFEVFATMVEKLKARQEVEIGLLDAAIASAREAGAEEKLVDKLSALRAHMMKELEKKASMRPST